MTTRQGSLAAHTREDHLSFGDPDTWGIDDRIGARQTCSLCRLIFNEGGGYKHQASAPSTIRARVTDAPRRTKSESSILPFYPATPGQLDFLKKLTDSRELNEVASQLVAVSRQQWRDGTFSKRRASALIEALKPLPTKLTPKAAPAEAPRKRWPDIPAGRYAIHTADLAGEHKNLTNFYRVSRPTDGPFAGRTFVKLQASDTEYPVRGEAAREVLEIIAKDQLGHLRLYGQLVGSCGHCGRTLTDDESRARGIGPTCAQKLGL